MTTSSPTQTPRVRTDIVTVPLFGQRPAGVNPALRVISAFALFSLAGLALVKFIGRAAK